jgi:transposase
MGAALSIEGSTDAAVFEAYVEGFLAPKLEAGQVVVLDRLGAHRTSRVRELIEERRAELVFLPSHSADLNPIEEAFSKMKNVVRKAGARTREALREALDGTMGEALGAVTLGDAAGWFSHCGYEPQAQYS